MKFQAAGHGLKSGGACGDTEIYAASCVTHGEHPLAVSLVTVALKHPEIVSNNGYCTLENMKFLWLVQAAF